MERSDTYTIPSTHPAIPGHFPGNPVVPGVLILERVKQSVVALSGIATVEGFPQVKFVSPLRPDEPFVVCVASGGPGIYAFECHRDGELMCTGRIKMRIEERA